MNHELYEKYLLYFRLFSQHAPIGMVDNFSQYKLTDARFACDSYGRWGIILSKD